jgi:hypothetical protein
MIGVGFPQIGRRVNPDAVLLLVAGVGVAGPVSALVGSPPVRVWVLVAPHIRRWQTLHRTLDRNG